jgi:flagellar protein FlbD
MIKLTRLGGEPFVLNADLIQYVEARPDTFVTLTTGERIVVTESMDEVLRRAVAYQQAKHMIPPPHPQAGTRSVERRSASPPGAGEGDCSNVAPSGGRSPAADAAGGVSEET